eukprot:161538_1
MSLCCLFYRTPLRVVFIFLLVQLLGEAGQDEGLLVDLGVVVAQGLEDLLGGLALRDTDILDGALLGGDEAANGAARVGRDVHDAVLDRGEEVLTLQEGHHLLDQGQVQPDGLTLAADDTAGLQGTLDVSVELLT